MTTTQKTLIAIAVAGIAVAGGTTVYETRRVSQMQEEIQTLQQQQEPLTKQIQQLREERDDATRQLTGLQQEYQQQRVDNSGAVNSPGKMAPTLLPSTATASATAESTESGKNPLSGLAKMFKDPAMKDMIRAQQKITLDQMYGDLFKGLNRSPTDLEALKNLLLDRQMAMVDAGMAAMGGSGADPKQAGEEAKTLKDQYDKQIQDLLGPQDYTAFQQYDQTVGERTQVNLFKAALSGDDALTDQQQNELIAAMHENRTSLPASSLLKGQSQDPSKFTDDSIADAQKQLEQVNQQDAERAAAILTPAQLEQFTKFQQSMSQMQAMGLKMAAQMFGKKNPNPASAASPGPTP